MSFSAMPLKTFRETDQIVYSKFNFRCLFKIEERGANIFYEKISSISRKK